MQMKSTSKFPGPTTLCPNKRKYSKYVGPLCEHRHADAFSRLHSSIAVSIMIYSRRQPVTSSSSTFLNSVQYRLAAA